MIRAAIAAALVLAGCAVDLPDVARKHVFRDNLGGSVTDYAAHASALRAGGHMVVIDGLCGSACAIIASLPNACLSDRAVIALHWPYLRVNGVIVGIPPAPEFWSGVTPQIARAVRATLFDPSRPDRATYRIAARDAERYGLRRC